MRIRTAHFVQVPTWALAHDIMRGDATKIAVYVSLGQLAWEFPDREWRSSSELASFCSDITGMAPETTRRHLRELKGAGLILLEGDLLTIPMDDPSWSWAWSPGTNDWSPGTNAPSSIEKLNREWESPRFETNFDAFWAVYPRRDSKPSARKSLKAALKAGTPVERIINGAAVWVKHWQTQDTPKGNIPYAATWLNNARWNDEPSAFIATPRLSGQSAKQAQIRSVLDRMKNGNPQ